LEVKYILKDGNYFKGEFHLLEMECQEAYNLFHHKKDFLKELKKEGFYLTREDHIEFKRKDGGLWKQVGAIIDGENFPPHLIIFSYDEQWMKEKDPVIKEYFSKIRKLAESFDSRY
jgi:hypothetical protein